VISCDNVITVPLIDLDETAGARIDQALRYSLDIVYWFISQIEM
jgi:hypothetical protein